MWTCVLQDKVCVPVAVLCCAVEGEGEGEGASLLLPAYGGRYGRCVPPSPRLASWFRRLQAQAQTRQPDLAQEFEVGRAGQGTHNTQLGLWHSM